MCLFRIHYASEQHARFSRKLKPAEVRYSTYDRELLAIYAALRHFKYFLEGRQFAVYTDHRPLTHLMTKISDPDSARQQRQASAISQYTKDIRHVSGKANVVADALSRISVDAVSLGIDFKAMAAAQTEDPDIARLRNSDSGLKLKQIEVSGQQLLCDDRYTLSLSTGQSR